MHADTAASHYHPLLLRATGLTGSACHALVTAGLPDGTQVTCKRDKDNALYLDIWLGDGDAEVFRFRRHLDVIERTAEHCGASVSPAYDSSGLSALVNRNLFALYQKARIETVHMHAGFVGAYAWARLGFFPTDEAWRGIRGMIGRQLDDLEAHPPAEGPLSSACVGLLRAAIESDDPKNLWLVADQETPCNGDKLGKALLIDPEYLRQPPHEKPDCISWDGVFDMQDSDCRHRMDAYIGRSVPLQKQEPKPWKNR